MIEALLNLDEAVFHRSLCWIIIISGAFTLVTLLLGITAPYGRYSTQHGWGPLVPARVAWMVMESPNLYISAFFFYFAADRNEEAVGSTTNRILLAMFVLHYINRAIIYPLRTQGRPMPLTVMLLAFMFCSVNGYLQARALTKFEVYGNEEWLSARVLIGVAVFVLGWLINYDADSTLLSLRKGPTDKGYYIPRGRLFEFISAPHFFGEIVEWTGYAIACSSLPGTSFALFTASNIGPRALQHHQWYLRKFEDYPAQRKALIPFLL
mmetsp:Transcript_17172/g.55164  ORF Transcript_17172/g.55164 Transcript_17172/m.55164 type:complete len:266 (+) Transcript_17172:3-800(+)